MLQHTVKVAGPARALRCACPLNPPFSASVAGTFCGFCKDENSCSLRLGFCTRDHEFIVLIFMQNVSVDKPSRQRKVLTLEPIPGFILMS
jgi:hypothetical protein